MSALIHLAKKSLSHGVLLPCVIMAYILAAFFPSVGIWAKGIHVVHTNGMQIGLSMLLLAIMLFNSSLCTTASKLRTVAVKPLPVLTGVVVNILVPIIFLVVLKILLLAWPDEQESQSLLVGLVVVAAMPVAGSSTAWSNQSNGNVALSLGLVLLSTAISPLTTPLVFSGFELLNFGHHSESIQISNSGSTGLFLLGFVVVPSAIGLLVGGLISQERMEPLKPSIKGLNSALLVFLCYSNASIALPAVIANPDWDFLLLVLIAAFGLCLSSFASGWLLASCLGVNAQDRRSLIFGLGMSNNGMGMVLSAASMAASPWMLLPVLTYNLAQHIVAALASRAISIEACTHSPRQLSSAK